MSWHEFVFSEKQPQRFLRHILFWLAWGLYFFISMIFLPSQTYAPSKPGYSILSFTEFVHLLSILGIHILASYAFIYFLLPRYLLKARYISLLVGIILLGFIMIQSTRFMDTIVFPLLGGSTDKENVPYYSSVFTGLISAIKIMAVAVAIKLVKHWWQKQKEKERLEKEKIETDLQLLKAQIHPGFLFNTLNEIYSFALSASPKAPEMLLKLSDILSYMLYECNDQSVHLDKEIKMLKDYMVLEKIRFNNKLEMNIQVKGETGREKIAPLLLLHFIENSFHQCNNRMTEQAWINLEMRVENHVLYMKLMNGKSPILPATENETDNNLVQAKKRLELLYPGRHELKIMEEPEIMVVNLDINLEAGFAEDENMITESPAEKRNLTYAG